MTRNYDALLEAKLSEALGRVLDRMGERPETLADAVEAVQDDFVGRAFGAILKLYAHGHSAQDAARLAGK